MGAPHTLDMPGFSMDIGDHICAFYRGEAQRDQVLLPYLRQGLELGAKCICVLDTAEVESMRSAVGSDGGSDPDQLSLRSSEDSYLVGGSFVPEEMLSFWEGAAAAAFTNGAYPQLRAVGEMTWALRDLPGVNLLIAYEAELNRFLPRYPQTILCLYDLEQFTDGEILIDVLRTHPKVLMSSMVIDNPWYTEPDQFLSQLR